MFSRQGLVAVLIISHSSTIQTANDDDTSQWVQQTFNSAADYDDLDLTPTGDKISDLDCITDNNEPGTCVVYYLCDPDSHTIFADGKTITDMGQRQCISYLEVCCGYKSILREDTLTTTQMQPKLSPHDIINFQEELQTTPAS
ncbi:uncharacterized protein LOC126780143 [Nymphalis io]|uniref:uncharacterized protein LOC126780143 n=1 Tax=Inachis io TaxID=171585 RepID=UPI002168DCBE|nr:uncharacterized protein LOC126780143 [Nymphalis io]